MAALPFLLLIALEAMQEGWKLTLLRWGVAFAIMGSILGGVLLVLHTR